MLKKFCYCDTETTGTVRGESEIVQISFIIENPESGLTVPMSWNVRPFDYKNPEIYSEGALSKTGMTIEQIMSFPDPREVYREVISVFDKIVKKYDKKDKMIFLGYNAVFDWEFLIDWFVRNGNDYFLSYFWYPYIDVCQKAANEVIDIRDEFPNFKLETVCRSFGIEFDESKAHGSSYDISKTRELNLLLDKLATEKE